MVSPAMSLLVGLVLTLPAAVRATTTSSSDPSCVTVEVAAASTFKSDPECPAVLVSVSLDASTDGCASDLEMVLVAEEYPRDVNTFGGDSYANLLDRTITWNAPALDSGMTLSLEFRMDFCGYCDKYNGGGFNPIDSIQYTDAEGNEPNDRLAAYRLKLACSGIDGDPVESIVATPAPVTSAPVATPVPTLLATSSPTVIGTVMATGAPTTSSPVEDVSNTTAPALPVSSPSPTAAVTPAPATSAPVATPAPTLLATSSNSTTMTSAPVTTAPVDSTDPTAAPALPVSSPSPSVVEAPASVATPVPTLLATSSSSATMTAAPVTTSPVEAIPDAAAPVVSVTPSPSAAGRSMPLASPAPTLRDTSSSSTTMTEPSVTTSPVEAIDGTTTLDTSASVATPAPTLGATSSSSTIKMVPGTASPVEAIASTALPVLPATPSPLEKHTSAPATSTPVATPTPTPTLLTTPHPTTSDTGAPATSSPTDSRANTTAPVLPATPSPSSAGTSSSVTSAPSEGLDVTSAPSPGEVPTSSPTMIATVPPMTQAPTGAGTAMPSMDTAMPSMDAYSSESAWTGTSSSTGADGSRGGEFTSSPTSAPTAAPTGFGGESSQGLTLEIQSIFEARRRALALDASDASDHALERRALSSDYSEDVDEYNEAMVEVCASMLGVPEEYVMSVSTDFGDEDGVNNSAARRVLMTTSSSSSEDGGITATLLTPITTCEVDLSWGGETRSVTAATLVGRMMQPENFESALNENRFGPVNVVVSSISFWQRECPDQTCPAGDGSYASVYPQNSVSQESTVSGDSSSEGRGDLWFIVIAGSLLVLTLLSWCAFLLYCGRFRRRDRESKPTAEERYSVKTPPKTGTTTHSQPRRSSPSAVAKGLSPEGKSDGTGSGGGNNAGPSPSSPARSKSFNRKRTPPPKLKSPQQMVAANDGSAPVEPPSPGEADWRKKFGLSPLRDYSYRSAPVSPRRSPSTFSGESTKASAGNPFYTSYKDFVVSAADGIEGGKAWGRRDSADAEDDQCKTSDGINASVQHNNDPIVRSSLSKAATVVANPLSSPRKELNRLKEALNRPSRLQSFPSTSPTVAASSAGHSPTRGFSEGCVSPNPAGGGGRHFTFTNTATIHEIDLEAEGNGETGSGADDSEKQEERPKTTVAMPSPSGKKKPGRNIFAKAPGSTSGSRSSSYREPTSPSARSTSTHKFDSCTRLNAVVAGARRSSISSVLTTAAALAEVKVGVQSPTGRAALAFASGGGGDGDGDGRGDDGGCAGGSEGSSEAGPTVMSPLHSHGELAPGAAAAAAGGGADSGKSAKKPDKKDQADGVASPAGGGGFPSMRFAGSPLSAFACLSPQISPRAGSRLPEINDEDEDDDDYAVDVEEGAKPSRSFARTSPQNSPKAVSRLPEINDDDDEEEEDKDEDVVMEDVGGFGKAGSERFSSLPRPPPSPPSPRSPRSPHSPRSPASRWGNNERSSSCSSNQGVGQGTDSSASQPMSLERAIAISRSRTITPDLTPVAELAEKEFFSDSEAESEASSLASSAVGGSTRGGGRRASRDPAALLAAAMEKAGKIADIPPPSAGSPGRIGHPLSAVQEVPMEAVPLHGLSDGTPELDGCYTPRRGDRGADTGAGVSARGSTTPTPTTPKARDSPTPSRTLPTAAPEPVPVPEPEQEQESDAGSESESESEPVPIPPPAQRPPRHESDDSEENVEEKDAAGRAVLTHGGEKCKAGEGEQEVEHGEQDQKAREGSTGAKDAGQPDASTSDSVACSSGAAAAVAAADCSGCPQQGLAASSSQVVPATAGSAGEMGPPVDEACNGGDDDGGNPGFSLKVALACFLERKEKDMDEAPGEAPVAGFGEGDGGDAGGGQEEEDKDETIADDFEREREEEEQDEEQAADPATCTADVREDPTLPPLMRSPNPHTLDAWPDPIVEKRPKSSLDDGFTDVSVSGIVEAMERETDDVADFKLPPLIPSADLPVLVMPTSEADTSSASDRDDFCRARMNEQSPTPDSPKGLVQSALPPLPRPTSAPSSAFSLQTPSATSAASRVPDPSPMYDREAIAKAMSQAERENDQDGDSDIVMPSGVWPSERRQASYTGSSVMTDVTFNSLSNASGSSSSSRSSSSNGDDHRP